MRLWSLHPSYLDVKGLVATWREALLAQAVLRGKTRGYRHHPQLDRFRTHHSPPSAIDAYLGAIHLESVARGYRFDASKFEPIQELELIPVTNGQLLFELQHLTAKIEARAPDDLDRLPGQADIRPNPVFQVHPGPVEAWERAG